MKDMQTEQFLCWNGMKDTEHAIPGSNDEEMKRRAKDAAKVKWYNYVWE